MNLTLLRAQLELHEGRKKFPYLCSAGKTTIGIGRNLSDLGVTEGEIDMLFEHDLTRVIKELDANLPWWRNLSNARQHVLIDMLFNLGLSRFLGFKKMLRAAQIGDYSRVAFEMLDSKWAIQVGKRALTLSNMMQEG